MPQQQQSRMAEMDAELQKQLRKELGEWLKTERQAKNLTQADLADTLGIRYYSFISQVEKGIGRIPQKLYRPWAEAIGIDPLIFGLKALKHVEPGLFDLVESALNEGHEKFEAEQE